MNNPLLVAIAGPKGAGKTSLCRLLSAVYARANGLSPSEDPYSGQWNVDGLLQSHGQAHERVILDCKDGNRIHFKIEKEIAQIVSFAGPLKTMAEIILGLDPSSIYGDDSSKSGLTQYSWDNHPMWIRWINSKTRSIKSVNTDVCFDAESAVVKSITSEADLWAFCASRGMLPANMRSGRMSAREILQVLGTDVFRNMFDQKVWVNALVSHVKSCGSQLVLVDDVRFDGELEAIAALGGVLIRFEGCATGGHESERGVSDHAMKLCRNFVSIASGDRPAAAAHGVKLLQEIHRCKQSQKKAMLL